MQKELLNRISTDGRLLGALFYYPPDNENVRAILHFFQQPTWLSEWMEPVDEHIARLLCQTQGIDEQYQALFIGPHDLPAPPWGSVYLDRESVIFGDSLLRLRHFLHQEGIEFQTAMEEPEDHIGIMLMLAAYLAENRPELLHDYLREHLLTWAQRYLHLLAEQQDYPFYQGLALLTAQTLHQWQQTADIEVPPVRFYR